MQLDLAEAIPPDYFALYDSSTHADVRFVAADLMEFSDST